MRKLEITARIILALTAVGCGTMTSYASGINLWEGATATFCFSYLALTDLHFYIT